MPIHTLSLRDSFTRADAALAAPDYAANAVLSATIPQVIGNQCGATVAFIGFVRLTDALPSAQGVRFTLVNEGATDGSDAWGVWFRGTQIENDVSATKAYILYVTRNANYMGLWAWDGAAYTELFIRSTSGTTVIAQGSVVQVEMDATETLSVYDDGVLTWQVQETNHYITSGAQWGFEFQATTQRIDDIYSGSIVETIPPRAAHMTAPIRASVR